MKRDLIKATTEAALALANDKEATKELYDLKDDHDFYVFMFGYMKKQLEYVAKDLA